MTDVTRVVLAGPAATHAYHAGTLGAEADAAATLAAARAAGAQLEVETPLTRSTYRVLGDLPATLVALGVARWRLRVLADDEVPAVDRDRVVPRLAMALPHALHALERAGRLGLAAVVVDAPRCLMGTFDQRVMVERVRSHPAPCAACRERAACAGVDPGYAARFGVGELRAR